MYSGFETPLHADALEIPVCQVQCCRAGLPSSYTRLVTVWLHLVSPFTVFQAPAMSCRFAIIFYQTSYSVMLDFLLHLQLAAAALVK